MSNLKQILTFAYDFEYESAYDLSQKKNFSNPKIYVADGDLTKRWYVYFSFRNPDSGKMKRMTPFYGVANKYKTKGERMEVLSVYRKTLLKLLKQGYNPFNDNTELFNKLKGKKEAPKTQPQETASLPEPEQPETVSETTKLSLKEAFDFGLKLKKNVVNARTLKDYEGKINAFLKWLYTKHPDIKTIDGINKNIALEYLNDILCQTSARNRNNYRADISSIMQVLEDNEIIESNFIKKIPVLKSKPERHKTYSQEMQDDIFKHLENEDPDLLLYIKFILYGLLRPIEINRVKIKDINLTDKIIQYKAKNSNLKTRIIPQILLDELPDLSKMNGDDFLFTPSKIGGAWKTGENNKRDYFTKRFRKMVKEPLGIGEDYGLYSFRHTSITKLYRELVKESSPFKAKSELMQITGHTSMTALEKYLRNLDAELPADYSEMLKKNNG
ncbi:site-specific integrase [Seonamhaeicola sp. ML3]|uniref:tyrosine-type recombinase/integrase n=1 Tax=Seonamhaeicola sp. ML3 TaxID=2937786 RepID=UPI00200DAA6C|nr:site-specific integrase [Seonamhaeicola sp. ML3]